uniref:Uncharacterized protein n=1 Tax=Anguilla anguilla TaxID=7936 RepID=A0A0E9SY08_ANGAN
MPVLTLITGQTTGAL